MTFRITISEESGVQVMRLAGWLENEAVDELGRALSDTSGPLRLELAELRSANQPGVMLLRALHAGGVSLVGASPFIRQLLGSETSRPPPIDGPKRRGGSHGR